MKWLESTGGPLILMPKRLASDWLADGSEVSEGGDYARACAIPDYIGSISFGAGNALVLGDSPDSTSVMKTPLGLAILRWSYADSEDDLLKAVQSELARTEVVEELNFHVDESEYMLFDSAFSGCEFEDSLEWHLEKGAYRVLTYLYEGQDVGFLAHVFQKS